MSTTPGEDTWVDAGLIPPDAQAAREAADDLQAAEHLPTAARPDLVGDAAEPDVVEQAFAAGDDDEDDYLDA